MIKLVRFEAKHLESLRLQPSQIKFSEQLFEPGYGDMLELYCQSFTAIDEAGKVIASAGFEERWPGHATAWALMSCDAGPHLGSMVRAMRGFLDHSARWRRIEASVEDGFEPGHRLMRLLGFEREGLARAYSSDGGDYWIYARIRP